jgi:hypothetical protein
MKLHENAASADVLPGNVIAFPRAHRDRPAAAPAQRKGKSVAITGAELNARLLLLFGICMTSATSALLAVHILHG